MHIRFLSMDENLLLDLQVWAFGDKEGHDERAGSLVGLSEEFFYHKITVKS